LEAQRFSALLPSSFSLVTLPVAQTTQTAVVGDATYASGERESQSAIHAIQPLRHCESQKEQLAAKIATEKPKNIRLARHAAGGSHQGIRSP
jgi:hypothetical protein